jgi:diacylglycerol kinase (ATP)
MEFIPIMTTLVIVNPNAMGGRALRAWRRFEPVMRERFPGLQVAITPTIADVPQTIGSALKSGIRTIIGVGGDGTNYALVNAIVNLTDRDENLPIPSYGTFPIGTGCDFASSRGIPKGSLETVDWLAAAQPVPADIGVVQFTDRDGANIRRCYLNIASGGISGDVSRRVNTALVKRPWTYLAATITSILRTSPPDVHVRLDGYEFYSGRALLVTCANSTTFGHGMRIAPDARLDDGLLDVVLVRDASKITVLKALNRVYSATHLTHPAVCYGRAREVRIDTLDGTIDGDLDGESFHGRDWMFTLRPKLLPLLSR